MTRQRADWWREVTDPLERIEAGELTRIEFSNGVAIEARPRRDLTRAQFTASRVFVKTKPTE